MLYNYWFMVGSGSVRDNCHNCCSTGLMVAMSSSRLHSLGVIGSVSLEPCVRCLQTTGVPETISHVLSLWWEPLKRRPNKTPWTSLNRFQVKNFSRRNAVKTRPKKGIEWGFGDCLMSPAARRKSTSHKTESVEFEFQIHTFLQACTRDLSLNENSRSKPQETDRCSFLG